MPDACSAWSRRARRRCRARPRTGSALKPRARSRRPEARASTCAPHAPPTVPAPRKTCRCATRRSPRWRDILRPEPDMRDQSIRTHLANLEQQGELIRFAAEIDPDETMSAVAHKAFTELGKTCLFENVKG